MRRNFVLEPIGPADKSLVFDWDHETGMIAGPDAETIGAAMAWAKKSGSVLSHPYPTSYEIEDPLHRPAEFAAVLSFRWKLDDYLLAEFAKNARPDDVPDDEPDCITLY